MEFEIAEIIVSNTRIQSEEKKTQKNQFQASLRRRYYTCSAHQSIKNPIQKNNNKKALKSL